MKILSWIIPIMITFAIFYFGKPSDEKCREIAIEKLAEKNIKASPADIRIDDKVFLKTINYVSVGDTLKVAHGFFFQVRMKDDKLENIKSHQKRLEPTQSSLSYFMDTVIKRAVVSLPNYKSRGLSGGIDGFGLLVVFRGLQPADFTGVRAKGGDYSVNEKGELVYTGNAASDSGVLTTEGIKTLLINISKRLNAPVENTSDINEILRKIEK